MSASANLTGDLPPDQREGFYWGPRLKVRRSAATFPRSFYVTCGRVRDRKIGETAGRSVAGRRRQKGAGRCDR
jgi:hypothetical protein